MADMNNLESDPQDVSVQVETENAEANLDSHHIGDRGLVNGPEAAPRVPEKLKVRSMMEALDAKHPRVAAERQAKLKEEALRDIAAARAAAARAAENPKNDDLRMTA